MKIHIRPAEARDERRWRELFNGYCLFYERKPDEALNTHTWRRIMDPSVPVHAIVAEMKAKGWGRLYWHTRNTNYRARGLYDKFTRHSDFVRYTVYPET